MTLVRAIGFHWHAVQRDLLALGFRAVDMFTPRLTAAELVSIVMAAPGTSALRYSLDGGFSVTDHLLATLSEQQAGLVTLAGRHERPGVRGGPRRPRPRIDNPNGTKICFDVIPLDEFRAKTNG